MMPFGVLNTFYISISLPFILPKFAIDFLSDKYTLIFSNLSAKRFLGNNIPSHHNHSGIVCQLFSSAYANSQPCRWLGRLFTNHFSDFMRADHAPMKYLFSLCFCMGEATKLWERSIPFQLVKIKWFDHRSCIRDFFFVQHFSNFV